MTSNASFFSRVQLARAVVVLLALGASSVASADDVVAPTSSSGDASVDTSVDTSDDAYEREYRIGLRHFEAREWSQARASFRRAYAHRAAPRLLFNIGSTYRRQGDRVRATRFYERFVAQAPADDPQRAFAMEILSSIEARSVEREQTGIGTTRIIGLTLTVAGLGGLGYAGYQGYLARSSSSQLMDNVGRPWTRQDQLTLERGERAARVARWAAVGGGATLATGLVLFWIGGTGDRGIVIAPRSGGGAVSVQGRF
jgi:tetratricopeptide (TPR) repeat protein